MTTEEYVQLRAFARQDGALLGAIWTLSFACFIGEFSFPILGTLAMIIAMFTPVFVAIRLKNFRDYGRGGVISFKRAFAYSVFTFFYASLIFALVQWIYFQFIDNGYLLKQYNLFMASDNVKELFEAYGVKEQMEENLGLFGQLSAIDKVLNFLPVNITVGIFLSLPIALAMKREKADLNNNINNQ